MRTPKILITGATGFLGRHVLTTLKEHKLETVAVVRSKSNHLHKLWPITCLEGSLSHTDSWSCHESLQGLTTIIHMAAHVSHSRKDRDQTFAVNVSNTLNLVRLAHQKNCRLVLISTSGTVGCFSDPQKSADETSPYCSSPVTSWPYYASKIAAETQAMKLAKELGVELVIVRPPVLLGPGDHKFRSTGHILKVLRQKLPFLVKGGIEFTDVRDVAAALIQIITAKTPRVVYHLPGTSCSIKDFFSWVQEFSSVPVPRLVLPKTLALLVSRLSSWLPIKSFLPDPVVIEMATHYWNTTSLYAHKDLGYKARDPKQTLRDTIMWLYDHHPDLQDHSQLTSIKDLAA